MFARTCKKRITGKQPLVYYFCLKKQECLQFIHYILRLVGFVIIRLILWRTNSFALHEKRIKSGTSLSNARDSIGNRTHARLRYQEQKIKGLTLIFRLLL